MNRLELKFFIDTFFWDTLYIFSIWCDCMIVHIVLQIRQPITKAYATQSKEFKKLTRLHYPIGSDKIRDIYASVNSKHQHPPGRPPGFCTLLLPRGRDLYLMTFPGGRVFAYP